MAKKNSTLQADTVLIKPRITEKAAILADKQNAYAFDVKRVATKSSVAASVRDIYGVTPEKVRIVNIPKKRVFVRGNWGMKGGGKKAYVYLKKGDKIEII